MNKPSLRKPCDVTVIGSAIMDVIGGPFGPEMFEKGSMGASSIKMTYGGNGLNEAVALSRLGAQVELITNLGQDEAGERVTRFLSENGVSTQGVRVSDEYPTGINIVLFDKEGERYFLTNPQGSLRKLSEEDILPQLHNAAGIVSFSSMFVSPLLDLPAMERIFRKIKESPDRTLVVDMTKAKNGETWKDLSPLLPYIDYILPNEAEMKLLSGPMDISSAGRFLLDQGVGCVVVKRGRKGTLVMQNDSVDEVPVFPVSSAVDTTGAGDCFAAGFLYGLTQKMGAVGCACFGNAAASCCVEQTGATDGVVSGEIPWERFKELKANPLLASDFQ